MAETKKVEAEAKLLELLAETEGMTIEDIDADANGNATDTNNGQKQQNQNQNQKHSLVGTANAGVPPDGVGSKYWKWKADLQDGTLATDIINAAGVSCIALARSYSFRL